MPSDNRRYRITSPSPKFDRPLHIPAADFLFRQQVQDEQKADHLLMARLNLKLQNQFGDEFFLQCFAGSNLERIPRSTLLSLAQCYADVFNESWGEDWTVESALEEIRHCINCNPSYLPVMTILFKEDRVIEFSWAHLLDTESLTSESAPFSSSDVKRHESVSVAQYWMSEVGNKHRLVSIRELGVIKEYRQDKTPYLTLPIFEKVSSLDCNVAFFRTRLTSKAFKWSLGVGFVPLQLFMVDDLLLMRGNVKYAMSLLYGSIDSTCKRKTQVEIIGNIKRYLCD
jgi:hypothetical protein